MRNSVRTRIVVTITIIVATVLLGFGAYGLHRRYGDLRARQERDVTTSTDQLANELWVLVHDYNRKQIDRSVETAVDLQPIPVVIGGEAAGAAHDVHALGLDPEGGMSLSFSAETI